jgi:pyruvate kinase
VYEVACDNGSQTSPADLEELIQQLSSIRAELVCMAAESEGALLQLHPRYQASAQNLLHYLALRRRDLRPLQMQLARRGLSSLGRAESHVLATLDAILELLHQAMQRPWRPSPQRSPAIEFEAGQRLLAEHTEALFGPPPQGRGVHVMVTMPSEAAEDPSLLYNLLQRGMDCMRINCAHDDASAWSRMIEHLRRAEQTTGRSCRILMDVAGPKLRTGPVEPGPAAVAVLPPKDALGRVTRPARVWLSAQEAPRSPLSDADACLPVPRDWLAQLVVGDRVTFVDARRARRALTVVDATGEGCWAEAGKNAYIAPGTILRIRRKGSDSARVEATVGDLPAQERVIPLQQGDLLILTRSMAIGRPATLDSRGQVLSPASLGCTSPELFEDVRRGEQIWFDDGKIGGVIERVDADRVHVRITQTRARGGKLRSDKGINLPDSQLRLAAVTPGDVEALGFMVRHADIVALSFANDVDDVQLLHEHLARSGDRRPAVVLKIETRRGFENLPAMLFEAMKAPCCGVMIARGDLAVECGFERMAEVQEEILWLCEAAHVPVIWATQVLESLAKDGLPSRAEITDAAMGHRAECVMLNKGPHITGAVEALDDILRRMEGHQSKKRSMLRELNLATSFRGW